MTRQPLYGHTDASTAYVVSDYPYGFKLRTEIRYWIERHPKRGWRFVSQTRNPKVGYELWNKPKASTYCDVAGAMYLDEQGHVQWTGLSTHSSVEACEKFVEEFPGADLATVARFAHRAGELANAFANGRAWSRLVLNGQTVERKEAENDVSRLEATRWLALAAKIEARS